ncbi:hypothetical protein [Agrobacterium tumefaciens]|uniref:hypothetical protein n=1 Tax=Agrobacterium tumefaciens TaxID=358 RepID=UPI001046F908|nr:hypothetical protein [Agrobacterium tumefaciens]TCV45239.1 hypothetical protein EDB97_1223 [Agrobacterium tumefaciens]
MQEKLIEHWLDSINERGYQAAFLQMLAGEGHAVVHSTRHMSIEFGKDVVSIDPDGVPCAFQLKGNPGGRLTLSQFREIKGQVDELVEQPIRYPGIPEIPHKCFLVTNGEVEEEVQRAIDDLNLGYERRRFHPNSRLRLISRGMLLDMAVKHSTTFWPESFSVHEKLIRYYSDEGTGSLNLELLSQGLDDILKISGDGPTLGRLEFGRREISAALFVSFATKNFANKQNHTSVASAFVTLFISLKCAHARHLTEGDRTFSPTQSAVRDAFFSAIIDLAEELGEKVGVLKGASAEDNEEVDLNRLYLTTGALSDQFLWRVRALSTVAMLSILLIEIKDPIQQIELSESGREAALALTRHDTTTHQIWGEGAIPQMLCLIYSWHRYDPSLRGNLAEYGLLQFLTGTVLKSGGKGFLASPYHRDEQVIRDLLPPALGIRQERIRLEVLPKSSYFAEALFQCFVRSNLKSFAKGLWPDLTRISHHSFVHRYPWEYCLWRIDEGDNLTRQLPHRQQWADLQIEASRIDTPGIPHALRSDPVMLLAFITFFPHRASPEVLRYLHFAICGTWFLPSDRPPLESAQK